MTGAEWLTHVKKTFKRTDKDTEIYDATKDAINHLIAEYPFQEATRKQSTLTEMILYIGVTDLQLPSDFGRLLGGISIGEATDVGGTDHRLLEKISLEEFRRLSPNPRATDEQRSRPTHYCFGESAQSVLGNSLWIQLWPVPDKDYKLHMNYSKIQSTDITAGTTYVMFSDPIHRRMMKYLVLHFAYSEIGYEDESAKWFVLYEREKEKLISLDYENQNAPTMVKYQGV